MMLQSKMFKALLLLAAMMLLLVVFSIKEVRASSGTVSKPEWKKIEYAYGTPKAQINAITDATPDLKKQYPLPNCTVIGGTPPQVYCGTQRLYQYKNLCDRSPVNITYTFYLGQWVLTSADAYYPDTSSTPGC